MAALYLHQALFTPQPLVSPILAHNAPSSYSSHDRRLSSISTVTVSTSEYSHPTEPLIHSSDAEPSAYLDLLARQPRHPSVLSSPADAALSLEGDPVTPSERKARWERRVRRKLCRLRWAKRMLLAIIGGWAIYNTVRYFLAFGMYRYRNRQIMLLALGTSTALSLTFILASLIIAWFAPRLGWKYRPHAPYIVMRAVLSYLASVLLLGPAVVNFVLVFVWRHSADSIDTLQGRCHWDIDVVWSGLGGQCIRRAAWGSWLAGAVARIVFTLFFLVTYHLIAYQYDVTRRPSRRRRRSRPLSGACLPSATETFASTRCLRPASALLPSSPASIAQVERQPSMCTSESHTTVDSYHSTGAHRPLQSSRSRISSQNFLSGRLHEVNRLPSAKGEKEPGTAAVSSAGGEDTSPSSSSEEDLGHDDGSYRNGQHGWRTLRAYDTTSDSNARNANDKDGTHNALISDHDLSNFANHFRSLVDQISRETEEGIALAQNNSPEYSYVGDDDEPSHPGTRFSSGSGSGSTADDYIPVLGRAVHRMPTIESLGSREMMSVHRASPGPYHMSRPSTRSNNFSVSDAGTSTPSTRSRANSLDAALALVCPAEDEVREDLGEIGELQEVRLAEAGSSSSSGSFCNSRGHAQDCERRSG